MHQENWSLVMLMKVKQGLRSRLTWLVILAHLRLV